MEYIEFDENIETKANITVSPTTYNINSEDLVIRFSGLSSVGQSCQIVINRQYEYASSLSLNSATFSNSIFAEGENTIERFLIFNGSWNEFNGVIKVNKGGETPPPVDNPPSINNINDINTKVGYTDINYTASDDNGIVKHELSQNGGSSFSVISPTKNGNTYTYRVYYSSTGNRQCKVRVTDSKNQSVTSNNFTISVTDESVPDVTVSSVTITCRSIGNSSKQAICNVTVNDNTVTPPPNKAPTISNIAVSNITSSGSYKIDYSINDADGDKMSVELKVGNLAYKVISSNQGNGSKIYNGYGLAQGNHVCYLKVSDGTTATTSNSFSINVSEGSSNGLQGKWEAYTSTLQGLRQAMHDATTKIAQVKTDALKSAMDKEIGDLNTAIGDLENSLGGAFEDGILSEAEKKAIKQSLQIIANEKADVDKQYVEVYNNVDLIGSAKTNFKSAYDGYVLKYNSLVSTINTILDKTGLVNETDQRNLNAAFDNYRVASGLYSQRVNQAIDAIANKKATDAENNANKFTEAKIKIESDSIISTVSSTYYDKTTSDKKFASQSQITQLSDSINLKVSKNDLLSEINIKSNGIEINSDDVTVKGVFSTYNRSTPSARYIKVADGFWHLYKNASASKPSMSAGYWGKRGTVPYLSIGRDDAWNTSASGMLYMTGNEDDYSEDYRLEYSRLSRDGLNTIMRSNLHFKTDGSVGYNSFFDNKTLSDKYSHNFDGGIKTVADIKCKDVRVDNVIGENVAIGMWGQGNYGGVAMNSSIGHFMPMYDNKLACGHPGFRWSTIHLMNSPTVTSDARCKENIKYTKDATTETTYNDMYNFVKDIELAQYDYKVANEDRVGIEHSLGFIAQDLLNDKVGELIVNRDVGEHLSYNLTTYINVLAGALKEAIKEVEVLKNEILLLKK